MKYTFKEIAFNSTEKRIPVEEDRFTYIGLEHLDSRKLSITRYGSDVPLKGEKLVMRKGDILFGKRNTYLKRVAIAPFDGLFSAHGMVLRPNENVISKEFFPFFLSSDYFLDEAIRISVGSLSPTVNWKDLKDLEFEIPDFDRQHKIAELLSAANNLKESYEAMITATDEMVKSQFIEMFGRTTNSKFPVQKLSEVCSFKSGTTFSPDEEKQEGDYMYAKVADMNLSGNETYIVRSTKYVNSDTAKSTWLPKGSVVFPKRGAAIHTNKKRVLSQNTCVDLNTIGVIPGKDINTLFLYWFFKCLNLSEICEDSGIPQINNKNLIPLDIVVPPMPEQIKFSIVAKQADKSKFAGFKSQFIEMFGKISQDKKLAEISEIYDGVHQTPHYTDSGIKFISVEDISDIYGSKKYISIEDYNKYKHVPELGDLIMTRIGTIGLCAVVSKSEPLAYYVSVTLIKPNHNIIDSTFLKYYIESGYGQNELRMRSLLEAFPMKINLNEIGKVAVKVPSMESQLAFVQIVQRADKSKYLN